MFPVFCKRRDELQRFLKEQGIETLIHYPIPPHKQECYKGWNGMSLPITEQIANEELSLPIGPSIMVAEVEEGVRLVNADEGYAHLDCELLYFQSRENN